MNNTLDFNGKIALVTGAASGMGLATAKTFAEAGAAVVLTDFREETVQAEAERLSTNGHTALALRCDVSDDAQVEQMIQQIVARFGRLDAAFNTRALCPRYRLRQRHRARSGIVSRASISAACGVA